MSGTITLALKTAQSGLLTNQQALNSVSSNIANVNTPGYSRKVVNVEQRVLNGDGAGVQLAQVTRSVDEGLLKSLRLQLGAVNALEIQNNYYGRLQDLFGTPEDNTSLSHIVGDFSEALELLAVSPHQTLEQSELVRRGQEITITLSEMSKTIQELRLQADQEVAERVSRVNELAEKIADLNDKIVRNNTLTADVSDLRDQRDEALDEMAENMDIRYYYRGNGDVVVFTASGRTLVDNVAFPLSHEPASTVAPTTTHAEGDFDGIYLGDEIAKNDITEELSAGALKGLVDLRDEVLPNLQSQLDELAASIKNTFNQIHNRGVSLPGAQSMTGTRRFLDTTDAANAASQAIQLDPTGGSDDVAFVLYDANGDQQAATTLNTIMTGAGLSSRGTGNDWTIAQVATQMQTWLQANGAPTATVGLNSDGRLAIELNNSSLSLGFRDETATADGSDTADAEIGFDKDGDGAVDETIAGFSNFFGLNDFFVDNLQHNMLESNVMTAGYTSPATTLRFVDGTSTLPLDPGGAGDVTLAIPAGSTLQEIAAAINANLPNVTASVVPDGSGYRLRVAHNDGMDLDITETGGNLLTGIGMHSAETRTTAAMAVREDIVANPALISSGALQWDATKGAAGEYMTSIGDDTTAQALADEFNSTTSFDAAGGLGNLQLTMTQYAASIVARNSSLADANENSTQLEASLGDALQYKSDSFRGVNLDEEMSNLILFQQAYSASARLITVIQNMFDALERSVG
jgi:flagellar hook-associated protein 1 FlgK